MHYSIVSSSPNQTRKIAKLLAKELKGEEVICLIGDLGGGKTTFAQGLALGLGIKEKITSPSFVLIKKYKIPKKSKILYHIDCYRLRTTQDILDLGFEEIISQKNAFVVVEWADKIKKILPKKRLEIKFTYAGKNKRKISFLNLK
jgi:tRNA threonylcarbamoyladenosine biosynthesis protein TsaE